MQSQSLKLTNRKKQTVNLLTVSFVSEDKNNYETVDLPWMCFMPAFELG
jgi:hypothetical protein